jgi:glycosyltransferase involved in cell wall biosynthesis
MQLSIVFYTADLLDAHRRRERGEAPTYATHGQLLDTASRLVTMGVTVALIGCVAATTYDVEIVQGLQLINLGIDPYGPQRNGIVDFVKRSAPDRLVVHFPYPPLLALADPPTTRTMAVIASSYHLPRWRDRYRLWQTVRALNRPEVEWVANHCRPSSEALVRHGVSAGKVLPYDFERDLSPSTRPAKRWSEVHEWSIAYVGSISEEKGVGDLIRSLVLVRASGIDARLRVAGTGDVDALRAEARRCGVDDHVEFVGAIANDRVVDFMRGAAIVAIPSRHAYPEGFPLTIFEALCSRSPIVASDHPMFRQALRDAESAAVFRSGSHEALARSIIGLAGDPVLYDRLSNAATETWAQAQVDVKWSELITRWVNDSPDDKAWLASHTIGATEGRRPFLARAPMDGGGDER